MTDSPDGVIPSYQRDHIRLTQWRGVPPRGRISLSANEVVGAKAFGASFSSDQDILTARDEHVSKTLSKRGWMPRRRAATDP